MIIILLQPNPDCAQQHLLVDALSRSVMIVLKLFQSLQMWWRFRHLRHIAGLAAGTMPVQLPVIRG